MKRPIWVLFVLVACGLLFVVAPLVRIGTDWAWYASLGYGSVYSRIVITQVWLGVIFGILMLVMLVGNLAILRRLRPRDGVWIGRNLFEIAHNPMLDRMAERLLLVGAVLVSVAAGFQAASNWREWLLFQEGLPFGRTDPIFGMDFSFYVFRLPFMESLTGWLLFAVILTFVGTLVLNFFYHGIHVMPGRVYVEPGPRRHLMCLLSLVFVLVALRTWLGAYALVEHQGPLIAGASYTDVNAVLPLQYVLAIAGLVMAAVLLTNAFWGGWRLSATTFLLLVLVDLVGLRVYPALLQRLAVAPNELDKERPYIQHNIQTTRFAYGLDHIQFRDFGVTENLTSADIRANRPTVESIRLWDRTPLLQTYRQLQTIRTYYDFVDADNDRYDINGRLLQVSLSPRELSSAHLPARNWINEHLTYTHGYGVCAGPVTRISSEGLPEFFVKDLPPAATQKALEVTEPRIYFGEQSDSYVIVNTQTKEFDHPSGDDNVYISKDPETGGPMGIALDSFLKKIAFFLRFAEPKILLSSDITAASRILYYRSVYDRASRVTPWVVYDEDPYMVISRGHLYWILDGYTMTRHIPYAQPISFRDRGVTYIRNSVKTVVNACTGSVTAYISDDQDPLVASYARVFPGLYKPLSEMDEDLRRHIRYPEELFSAQSEVLSVYHMEDPQVFYNKEDVWRAPEQERQDGGQGQAPYYTILKFPKGEREEFILMTPFTPANKQNMIAWMAARCDAPYYGQLLVYRFPKTRLIYGPTQIDARINQDPEISRQVTLWSQQGSAVHWGSLLVIPIEESIIYVKPLYIESRNRSGGGGQALPQLKRVIVAYGNHVAMEETLEHSLAVVFGKASMAGASGGTPSSAPSPEPNSSPVPGVSPGASPHATSSSSDWPTLARQAQEHMDRAEAAQRAGNWAVYGQEIQQLKATIQRMRSVSAGTRSPGGTVPSPGGTSSPGGTVPSPGGTLPAPGGTSPSPGGTSPSPGGMVPAPGGTVPAPGGTVPAPGGTSPSPGGMVPSPGGTP